MVTAIITLSGILLVTILFLQEMILQHIEILKYLVEQDPKIKANKIMFSNTIGEA